MTYNRIPKETWQNFRRKVGQNIKRTREEQNLSLTQLSEQSGYSIPHLEGFEDRKKPIDLYNIARLAYCLNISPEILLK